MLDINYFSSSNLDVYPCNIQLNQTMQYSSILDTGILTITNSSTDFAAIDISCSNKDIRISQQKLLIAGSTSEM